MTHSRPLSPPSPPDIKIPFNDDIKKREITIPISPVNDNTIFHAEDIIHDPSYCMFKIQLDTKGTTAALCYLPTKSKNIIEFYHIEIPIAYRHQGLGDLLLSRAFQWVKMLKLLVIPTCPFVRKYLETHFPDKKSEYWSCIVLNEYNKYNGNS